MTELFKKLTKNYRLSMFVAYLAFVLTYAFSGIYKVKSFLSYVTQYLFDVPKSWLLTAGCCIVFGFIGMVLFVVLTRVFFAVFKIYTVPHREAVFISLLVFSVRNLILGCLNLLVVFLPPMISLAKIFFLVLTMAAFAVIYAIYDKYYLHAKAAPAFFKLHLFYWGAITLVSLLTGFLF